MDQSSDTERRHWFAQVDLHPTSAGQQEGRSLTPSACTPSSCPACSEGCDCHVPPCPSALPVVLARSLVFGGCSSCPCWLQSDGRQGPQQGSASPSLPSMCSTSRLRTLIVLLDRQEGTQIRWIPAVSQVLGDLLFLYTSAQRLVHQHCFGASKRLSAYAGVDGDSSMLALDTLPMERILEQGTPLMASGGQALR